jgi:hypothetical protein
LPTGFGIPAAKQQASVTPGGLPNERSAHPSRYRHFHAPKKWKQGEKRTFVRDNNNPRLCFVSLMLQIFKQFISLLGWEVTSTPLTIYQTESGDIKMITATEINVVMRSTAAAVYGLDPVKHAKDLQLWSSHSLRVGACVVLHAHGFTGPQIQFLLRWKSDAFMAYLRNLGKKSTS